MVWDVIKIILIVLAAIVGLVLALLLLLGVASCFNVRVRFSNFGDPLLVVGYGLLRFKVLPKKKKPEPDEEPKKKQEEKKKKREEKRKCRREKLRRRYEKHKVRRAVRKERRKARKAAKDLKKGKKPRFSNKADWLSEPVEGKGRAIAETLFDILPHTAKLLRFDDIRLTMIVRGEDPAKTGIAYGRIAAAFGLLYPRLQSIFNIGKHNVQVDADFVHKGETDTFVDITAILRPIKIVGLLFRAFLAWFRNKDIYCVTPKTTRTTVNMKPDGGNKHG
ncbi:MAG: DUF2953 domain-containing protein [Clostridia bacterium]|nr:DUF2953 domain-containing protein [Clostridia bacterium]